MSAPDLDMKKVEEIAHLLFGKIDGAMTCALAMIGDRLGLYRALADGGPQDSAAMAARTGLHERWVREWLHQQAAAGVIDFESGRFSLSPEAIEILANEQSALFSAGVFESVVGLMKTTDTIDDSFRTGIGASYDSFGPEVTRGIERMFAPFFRTRLVPEVLPTMDGVVAKLEAGVKVADVGCGGGIALIEMAKAFPASRFHGFDNSEMALERAATNFSDAGLSNVTFHDASVERLEEDESYDLITTFDCLHDMTHPTETIGAIRRSLKADGTWFVSDIRGHSTFEENHAEHPFAGMLYGFSVLCCMRSAAATEDGEALGTLGFTEDVARRTAEDAGFTKFVKHDFDNPLNDYYEVRL